MLSDFIFSFVAAKFHCSSSSGLIKTQWNWRKHVGKVVPWLSWTASRFLQWKANNFESCCFKKKHFKHILIINQWIKIRCPYVKMFLHYQCNFATFRWSSKLVFRDHAAVLGGQVRHEQCEQWEEVPVQLNLWALEWESAFRGDENSL